MRRASVEIDSALGGVMVWLWAHSEVPMVTPSPYRPSSLWDEARRACFVSNPLTFPVDTPC